MKSTRQLPNFPWARTLAALALGFSLPAWATNVPRGGTRIPLPAGTDAISVDLLNDTQQDASDVRFYLESSQTLRPHIERIESSGLTDRKGAVDKNGNEKRDSDERDLGLSEAVTGARVILGTGQVVAQGDSVGVKLKLNRKIEEGDKLIVVFSTEGEGSVHYDLCSVQPLPTGNRLSTIALPAGGDRMLVGLVNAGTSPNQGLIFTAQEPNGPVSILAASLVLPGPAYLPLAPLPNGNSQSPQFRLPPLPPGQSIALAFTLARPTTAASLRLSPLGVVVDPPLDPPQEPEPAFVATHAWQLLHAEMEAGAFVVDRPNGTAGSALPPDFFDPGSEPFWPWPLSLVGSASDLSRANLIVQRGALVPVPGDIATAPLQVVDLNLVAEQPLVVRRASGETEAWSLHVTAAAAVPQPVGELDLHASSCGASGEFTWRLPVRPRLEFVRASDGATRVLDGATAGLQWEWRLRSGGFRADQPPVQLSTTSSGSNLNLNPAGLPLQPNLDVPLQLGMRTDTCGGSCGSGPEFVRPQTLALSGQSFRAVMAALPLPLNAPDTDHDGVVDPLDNAPNIANPWQDDLDNDGVGDVADNAPTTANPCQEDRDGNGRGDVSESVPLRIQSGREGMAVHWPADYGDEYDLLASAGLGTDWRAVDFPHESTATGVFVHVPASEPMLFLTTTPKTCDCAEVKLLKLDYSTDFDSKDGKTTVTLGLDVTASITCEDLKNHRRACEGTVSWKATASNWGPDVNVTDLIASQSETIHGKCQAKASTKTVGFKYQTRLVKDRPVRGTVEIEITVGCPGGAATTRKIKVVIDSNANQPGEAKGIDGQASDLDADGRTGAEEAGKSDPHRYDTDGDGKHDGEDPAPKDPKK